MEYNITPGASTSNQTQYLAGNKIHDVTFKGAETKTIESKSGEKFNILTLKFANSEGTFEDTIFELREGDDKRKKNSFQYENPSAMEELIFKIKHLLAAVVPATAKKIDEKGGISISSWKALTDFVVKHATPGVGVETQIKLVERTDAKGTKRVSFPSFVLGITKKGEVYPKTNFIGSKLAWTAKEQERINTSTNAQPSDPEVLTNTALSSKPELELNLDLDGI